MSSKTIFKEDVKNKYKKPAMYKVFLLNDDYSTMDFVVEVIIKIFHKSEIEAAKIMMDVHVSGKGIVGVYTYDIAATKVLQVELLGNERGYPLKAGMEEE